MYRGPDGVDIVTADMSISVVLYFCFAFAPECYVQHDELRQHLDLEMETTIPCVLYSTARYSGEIRACVRQYRDLYSKILCSERRGLAISVFRRPSVVAQSFEVRLLLVGIPLFLVL
jgi:hypothetical protein